MKSKGEVSDNDELGDLLDEEDVNVLLNEVMDDIEKLLPGDEDSLIYKRSNLLEETEDQRVFLNSLLDLEID